MYQEYNTYKFTHAHQRHNNDTRLHQTSRPYALYTVLNLLRLEPLCPFVPLCTRARRQVPPVCPFVPEQDGICEQNFLLRVGGEERDDRVKKDGGLPKDCSLGSIPALNGALQN